MIVKIRKKTHFEKNQEITHLCHNMLDDSEAAHGSSSHGSHSSSARSEPYQGLPSRYALVSPGAIQSANGAAVHG